MTEPEDTTRETQGLFILFEMIVEGLLGAGVGFVFWAVLDWSWYWAIAPGFLGIWPALVPVEYLWLRLGWPCSAKDYNDINWAGSSVALAGLCVAFAVSGFAGWHPGWCLLLGSSAVLLLWTVLSRISPRMRDKLMSESGMGKDPVYLANEAAIESQYGRHEQALELCDRAIAEDPECKQAFYNKGVALLGLDRPGEAEHCLREAVRIDEDFWEAWHNLAVSLQQQGRHSEAEECVRMATAAKRR